MLIYFVFLKEEGSSLDPCSLQFCGYEPFSEIELQGLLDFFNKSNMNMVSYLNFHSYSQYWMTPYGKC